MSVVKVSPAQVDEFLRSHPQAELIDVRTPAEFETAHAKPARNVPLNELDSARVLRERKHPDQPLFVICQSGSRAQQAAEKLVAAGGRDIQNVEGGTKAWEQAGLPMERGRKTMSLERQVRIAAGAISCAGALLAYFVHPAWSGVPAFIGAGLVFAGVTDTCGMAAILARMPWNQRASCQVSR